MIEAFRDPCVVKAEVARQGRRRPAQVVRRERLEAEQRADAGRFHLALDLCRAAQSPSPCGSEAGKDILLLAVTRASRPATPSAPREHICSSCRPTAPTSTRSSRSSPNSNTWSEPPGLATSSVNSSTSSQAPSAQTISETLDMFPYKNSMLLASRLLSEPRFGSSG